MKLNDRDDLKQLRSLLDTAILDALPKGMTISMGKMKYDAQRGEYCRVELTIHKVDDGDRTDRDLVLFRKILNQHRLLFSFLNESHYKLRIYEKNTWWELYGLSVWRGKPRYLARRMTDGREFRIPESWVKPAAEAHTETSRTKVESGVRQRRRLELA